MAWPPWVCNRQLSKMRAEEIIQRFKEELRNHNFGLEYEGKSENLTIVLMYKSKVNGRAFYPLFPQVLSLDIKVPKTDDLKEHEKNMRRLNYFTSKLFEFLKNEDKSSRKFKPRKYEPQSEISPYTLKKYFRTHFEWIKERLENLYNDYNCEFKESALGGEAVFSKFVDKDKLCKISVRFYICCLRGYADANFMLEYMRDYINLKRKQ